MVERESEAWVSILRFRDLLRADASAAREYADAKEQLARDNSANRDQYQAEKDHVVQRILRKTR
jgi:GrpB-like predicted nucleotidyltransferase (UPF0157 family)